MLFKCKIILKYELHEEGMKGQGNQEFGASVMSVMVANIMLIGDDWLQMLLRSGIVERK